MIWAGHVACMVGIRSAYNILVGKPERKRPLGRHVHRWEDNVRIYLKDTVYECSDWICLPQEREQMWM